MHVEPLKLMLKAPGTKRSKLICDVLLSTSGFKFNLRRYTEDRRRALDRYRELSRRADQARPDSTSPAASSTTVCTLVF